MGSYSTTKLVCAVLIILSIIASLPVKTTANSGDPSPPPPPSPPSEQAHGVTEVIKFKRKWFSCSSCKNGDAGIAQSLVNASRLRAWPIDPPVVPPPPF
ncbi:hypothetical protein SDJN03_07409, partial [Cucurbita argyrosperma subsp. sororia]